MFPAPEHGAAPDEAAILSDENSLWGADVYIAIAKDIPGARTTTLSGTFLTKVFEGPYRNMRNWVEEMKGFVKGKENVLQKLYFFYTTCPKCSKKYGKNYVVILAGGRSAMRKKGRTGGGELEQGHPTRG